MRIASEDKKETIITVQDCITVASSIVAGALGTVTFGAISKKGAHPVVSGMSSGLVGTVGSLITKNVLDNSIRNRSAHYVPNRTEPQETDQVVASDIVADRYRLMWETRRRKYGKKGRRNY